MRGLLESLERFMTGSSRDFRYMVTAARPINSSARRTWRPAHRERGVRLMFHQMWDPDQLVSQGAVPRRNERK